MSWSLSTVVENYEHTDAGVNKVIEALKGLPSENIGNMHAVKEISVSMSGHANPNNQKTSEFASDYVSISMYVKKYREV